MQRLLSIGRDLLLVALAVAVVLALLIVSILDWVLAIISRYLLPKS